MAQGDGAIYNNFKEQVMEGIFQLQTSGHALYLSLHTGYTPDVDAHGLWGDTGVSTTEYTTGAGYNSGEHANNLVAGQDVTQIDATNLEKFDATDHTWASLVPLSPATPSHVLLRDGGQTSPADPLICYWELGTTATNGGNYTIQFHADGIITLT